MALTSEDGKRMIVASQIYGQHLYVSFPLRVGSVEQEIRTSIQRGDIGENVVIQAAKLNPPPLSDWYFDKAKSGKVGVDLGIHYLDWLRTCLGEPINVKAPKAVDDQYTKEDIIVASELTSIAALKFKKDIRATIIASWAYPENGRTSLVAEGSEGKIVYLWNGRNHFDFYRKGKKEKRQSDNTNPFVSQLDHFITTLQTGEPSSVLADGHEGLASLNLALRVNTLAAKRRLKMTNTVSSQAVA